MIEAICGIFVEPTSGQVLLLQRTQKRTFNPGKLDLMGGDIQLGEDPWMVLVRDAKEKLGLDILTANPLGELIVEAGTTPIKRQLFACNADYTNLNLNPKSYQPRSHWIDPSQLEGLDLCPGIAEIVVVYLEA